MEDSLVQYLSDPELFREKEQHYLAVRQREGRVLPDEWVRQLPDVQKSSPYALEWRWRKRAYLRFCRYLNRQKPGPLRILDLGCGNGWMANQLAMQHNWTVVAIDLNQAELEQAARLFGRKNLQFIYADLENVAVGSRFNQAFDIILLAASVQYFPGLTQLMQQLKPLLAAGGEIHCLDSNFYKNEKARQAAQQRTADYYDKVGVPAMSTYYHHHLWAEMKQWGAVNLNGGLMTRLWQKLGYFSSFPWVRLLGKDL